MSILDSVKGFFFNTPVTPPPATPSTDLTGQTKPAATITDSQTASTAAAAPAPRRTVTDSQTASTAAAAGPTAAAAGPTPAPATPVAATPLASTGSLLSVLEQVSKPNILNSYFQPTYHFRLIAATDADLSTKAGGVGSTLASVLDTFSKLPQVVIAESGVTSYSIKDVTIEANIGPNVLTRNTNALSVKMTIVEPMGVTFLDALRDAALKVGIVNTVKSFYYLELTFRAYNEAGEFVSNPCAGMGIQSGGRWLWQLVITDVETSLDAGGGTYTLTCTPMIETALKETELLRPPETMTISGSTVAEVLKDYMGKLTSGVLNRYGGNLVTYQPPVFHPVTTAPNAVVNLDSATFKALTTTPGQSSSRSGSMDIQGGVFSATIATGTSITEVIETIIANTEQGQNLGLDRNNTATQTTQSPGVVNDRGYRESILLRVESDVKIMGYDYANEKYIREITFHIWPYYTSRPIIDRPQVTSSEKPAVQSALLRSLVDKGFVAKQYQYLFTGLNNDVLEFDTKFNMAWAATLPTTAGAQANYESVSQGARSNGANTPTGNRSEALPQLQLDLARQATSEAQAGLTTANTALQSATTARNLLMTQIQQAGSFPTDQDVASLTKATTDLTTAQTTQASALAKTQFASGKLQALVTSTLKQVDFTGSIYAEDLIAQKGGQTSLQQRPNGVPLLPITFEQEKNNANKAAGTSMSGSFTRDKSLFGTILDQLYQPSTVQYQSITMTIKGDPFWIGYTDIERQVFMRSATTPPPTAQANLPDFMAGDHCLWLRFKFPVGQYDDFQPIFREDTVYNGIYQITRVVNSFADGQFRQTLTGNRLSLIDMSKALAAVAADDAVPASTSGLQASGVGQTTPAASSGSGVSTATVGTPIIGTSTNWSQDPRAAAYSSQIEAASAATGVPVDTLYQVIGKESSWNINTPNSSTGAVGMGQILPSTAAKPGYGVTPLDQSQLSNPEANITFTAQYLAARAKSAGSLNAGLVGYSGSGYSLSALGLDQSGHLLTSTNKTS